jgi:hypothetical protein
MRLNRDPATFNVQNNYFTGLEKKYPGDPNPIVHLKPEQIQKSAKDRIFKEMVKGQIDYSQYGQFFFDPKFIGNLLIAANDELNNNPSLREALVFYDLHYPNNPKIITLLNKHTGLMQIYGVLVDKLNMVSTYDNIGYLTDISYILANFRNII